MILISVDPNVKRMALAVWEHGELRETYYLRSDLKGRKSTFGLLEELKLAPDEIAVETMVIYPGREKLKRSLLKLQFFGGFAAGVLGVEGTRIHMYPASGVRSWKPPIPKEVMLPRIIARLTSAELARVDLPKAKSFRHDIWDAVGIGLHHLGRLK